MQHTRRTIMSSPHPRAGSAEGSRLRRRQQARLAVPVALAAMTLCQGAQLDLEQRVNAQRAIEEVYWRHRIWPEQNPQPKPPLSAVLPDESIRQRVEDDLRKSKALELYWSYPLTADAQQAEMDRMARESRDPALLKELFAALGDDPHIIAECLVRPRLADHLLRSWFSRDQRVHGPLRSRVEDLASRMSSVADLRNLGGHYTETTWKAAPSSGNGHTGEVSPYESVPSPLKSGAPDGPVVIRWEEWPTLTKRLHEGLDVRTVQEDDQSFSISAVVRETGASVTVGTARFAKEPFDTWWLRVRSSIPAEAADSGETFHQVIPGSAPCTDDTWVGTKWGAPHDRFGHRAVWTGSEMIVWGGTSNHNSENADGGRYDPATDTWMPMRLDATTAYSRVNFTMVWTGTEVIVWGGSSTYSVLPNGAGGRYNPQTNSWLAVSSGANNPGVRENHTAIWTGTEMIIWGGSGNGPGCVSYCISGGRYNPGTDSWLPTSTGSGLPSGRKEHTAIWTNGKMIIWGGTDGFNATNTGSAYSPATDSWTALSTTGAPLARSLHTAVWTGSEMIIWGGRGTNLSALKTGGRYKPSTNTWTPTNSTSPNVPAARYDHEAVWTGTQMIIAAGGLTSGGRYTPSTDSWTTTSTTNAAATGRAVWTGSEMILWGGRDPVYSNTGGRYNPATNIWTPTVVNVGLPTSVSSPRAVWTGAEMIVGGSGTSRYDLATNSWTPLPTTGAPPDRVAHVAVWTGVELVVWGGYPDTNTGGRYNPTTNTWQPTSLGTNVPSPRYYVEGVWTGRELIVWGGYSFSMGDLNTGGRYEPSTDTWQPTSLGTNVPPARSLHTAIWTGSEMIVWGGDQGSPATYPAAGGRYDPRSDTWQGMSTVNAPVPRSGHTSIWTGSEMIMFGGYGASSPFFYGDGGRYAPSADQWIAIPPGGGAPSLRELHSSVWTGSEMITWGGLGNTITMDDGARYTPNSSIWRSMGPSVQLPWGRAQFASAWTGSQMFVWGGGTGVLAGGASADTGGLYCAGPCSMPTAVPAVLVNGSAPTVISWSQINDSTRYDVVAGDLQLLWMSGGNFTAATTRCLANDTPATQLIDPSMPVFGNGFWYLVRGLNCGNGSYDDQTQIGSRDLKIALAASACP